MHGYGHNAMIVYAVHQSNREWVFKQCSLEGFVIGSTFGMHRVFVSLHGCASLGASNDL